jgi:carbon-monoxide dehydrogenase medium subunit
MTRHRDSAAETRFTGTLAVLPRAAAQIANPTVRNMGTIGGSISFADPGLDYPPALVAADAVIEIAASAGRRRVAASEFFTGWYETALQRGELVAAVLLPAARPGVGLYHKLARVSGDYATVSVALVMERSGAGIATRAAIGACGPTPILLAEANTLLSGSPGAAEVARAGKLLQDASDPLDDVRGSAEYRRMLIPRMLARAFDEAHASLGAMK